MRQLSGATSEEFNVVGRLKTVMALPPFIRYCTNNSKQRGTKIGQCGMKWVGELSRQLRYAMVDCLAFTGSISSKPASRTMTMPRMPKRVSPVSATNRVNRPGARKLTARPVVA